MKTFLLAIVCGLAASTAGAQLLQDPEPEKVDANKAKEAVGERPADRGGPGGRNVPAGIAAPGGPAAHAAMPPASNPMFEAIDVDGDGIITKKELRTAISQLKKLDTDGDGNISLAEASPQGLPGGPVGVAGPGAQPGGDINEMVNRLMQNDRNGDGKLTADELPSQMAQQMIQNGDKDGDRALSKDEITQALQNMQNQFGNAPGGFQGGPGNFAGGPAGFQGGAVGNGDRQMIGQWLQWDRNGDGMLSPNEVPQQAAGLLRGGDLNNDGMISPAELKMLIERNGDRMRNIRGRNPADANNADKDGKGAENNNGSTDADGKKRPRRAGRET